MPSWIDYSKRLRIIGYTRFGVPMVRRIEGIPLSVTLLNVLGLSSLTAGIRGSQRSVQVDRQVPSDGVNVSIYRFLRPLFGSTVCLSVVG